MKPVWNIEEQTLSKPFVFKGNEPIYVWESQTSREDKIAFVDEYTNGELSYILALGEKYQQEEPKMPHDGYGAVKTVSLRAWIKKNDTQCIIDNHCHYGNIHSNIVSRYIQHFDQCGAYDTHSDVVDEAFHRTLKKLAAKEKEWFNTHDEGKILEDRIEKYSNKFGDIIPLMFSSSEGVLLYTKENGKYTNERKPTVPELRKLVSCYEKIEDRFNAEMNAARESLDFSCLEPKYSELCIQVNSIEVTESNLRINVEAEMEAFLDLIERHNQIYPEIPASQYYSKNGPTIEIIAFLDSEPVAAFKNENGELEEVSLTKTELHELCEALYNNHDFREVAYKTYGAKNAFKNPYIKIIQDLANDKSLKEPAKKSKAMQFGHEL